MYINMYTYILVLERVLCLRVHVCTHKCVLHVLQCVAVYYSVLQCVTACCTVVQCAAEYI